MVEFSRRKLLHSMGRSVARLRAVQDLYAIEMLGEIDQAERNDEDDAILAEADLALTNLLVSGVTSDLSVLDALISENLTGDWVLSRLQPLLHAILRLGTFELLKRPAIPVGVIIVEYVDLAKAFYEGQEAALVHAVFDRMGAKIRGESPHKNE